MKDSLPSIAEMVKQASIRANKKFGQNFIFNSNILDKIALKIPNLDKSIIFEIGPGPAGLSRSILNNGAKKLIVIEKDMSMSIILDKIKKYYNDKIDIIYDDAINYFNNFKSKNDNLSICSNLPYNIGTKLLINWITDLINGKYWINSFTLMFQREVADRIIANHSTKHYCRLSVLISLISEKKEILFKVPRGSFSPMPSVDSATVQIIPCKNKIKNINIKNLEFITNLLFNKKRKMIRSICPKINWSAFNLNGTERAENITPETFLEMSKKINLFML